MPKPDKRCHYKIRQCQDFYLFRKHNIIYYAYYPALNLTRSTRQTNIHKAYIEAYDIMERLGSSRNLLFYKTLTDKKRQRDLNRALKFVDQNKPLSSSIIQSIQKKMLEQGLSGKSINNYIYILRQAYNGTFPEYKNLEHKTQYRSCFPIQSFYGFWKKCTDRLDYLAFFAMTTGCRLSEIYQCEPVEKYGRQYLKINGTKTSNARRTIPVIPETLSCIEHIKGGFRTSAYKESVVRAGSLCGFDESFIAENRIVFHSYRKMYKTLLESCEVPNSFVEFYLGHAQNNMDKLYFIGNSADDTDIYPRVIDALRRFI